jgi:DNA (cytosine-5)-methyltransferase 1
MTPTKTQFSVVSLFSGCGGLDLGFRGGFTFLGKRFPKLPFRIDWANDLNAHAVETYRRNLGQDVICGDIWEHLSDLPQQTDVLIGGFPCQDVSVNGKRKGLVGTRTGLYRAMVAAVEQARPSIFVAENVKGLLMGANSSALETVLTDFSELGYEVSYGLYQTADYGVPQTRERVFIVGTAPKITPFSPPTPRLPATRWIAAQEAIGDLEDLTEDPVWSHIWSRANRSAEQGNRRLRADRPAYTIRAEHHGNIQFHYSLPRRISMREAARFQSFPDDFIFASRLRETERQIGNAVPPVMAWHIAKAVTKSLSAHPKSSSNPGRAPTKESTRRRKRQPSLAIS